MSPRSLLAMCIAEVIGTFFLVLFGTGVVASAVLTESMTGLWQVAIVWGLGITIAIYATAAISGAHLNPAVTLSMALFRPAEFPWSRLPAYCGAQLLGAVIGSVVVLATFSPFIDRFNAEHELTRGGPGSEASAMIFGDYFPNPAMFGTDEAARALVSPLQAFGVEALGTGVLVFMILALTDRRNGGGPGMAAPLFIGLTVVVLITLIAPITQAGLNPARDFGPRLVALAAGWGSVAIPGPGGGFWVYILGPLIGGPLGGAIYQYALRPAFAEEATTAGRVPEAVEAAE